MTGSLFILDFAMIAGHVFVRRGIVAAHMLFVLTIPRPASRTRGISTFATMAGPLLELYPAMRTGYVSFRGWSGIRAHMLFMLTIPRPASRARGISAAAVVAFTLFILDFAMIAGHVFIRRGIVAAHVLFVLTVFSSAD